MTGQSGQKTTGGKISPLSKFVSTPGDGEKVRQGAGDPLYKITEVNNGISLFRSGSREGEKGERIALRITKFRNNRGHARESRTALDHSRFRDPSPIVRGPSPITDRRENRLMSIVSFYAAAEREKKTRVTRVGGEYSCRSISRRPNYTGKTSRAPRL